MSNPADIAAPEVPVSAELQAARTELQTLHEIMSIILGGRMPPQEWPKAKAVLEYIDGLITAAQSRADALEVTQPESH